MAGVYVHIFPNNKLYIGITKSDDCSKRWVRGKGYDSQQFMHRAIQKYGWDNIKHIILMTGLDISVAQEVEKYLIMKYRTQNPQLGYNISGGGDTNAGYHHTEEYKQKLRQRMIGKYKGDKNPNYGKPVSSERRNRISKSLLGRTQSKESCEKRSLALMGHVVSDETRSKISNAHKGKIVTDETRKRISMSHKGRSTGREGYWKGKTQSPETVRKRSEALKGRPKSPETIEKLRAAALGKKHGPMSEQHRRNISIALTGKQYKRRVSDA